MGILDFLKITVGVGGKKKAKAPVGRKPQARAGNTVEFDGKSFPLAALNTKGFVISQFDGSLIKGQTARITVKVDDGVGRFSFPATVGINEVADGKCVGEFNLLSIELSEQIRKYTQLKKQKAGAR